MTVSPVEGLPALGDSMPDTRTERLVLRRFREDDLEGLAPVFAKPEVWAYPYGRGFTLAETEAFVSAQVDHWDACGVGLWLAIACDSGRTLGFVGLSVPTFLPEVLPALEVGWRLDPDVWGMGYATEGARAALDQAFTTLALTSVCSLPQAGNEASLRVAQRLGFHRERDFVLPATDRRGEVVVALFSIGSEEWLSNQ